MKKAILLRMFLISMITAFVCSAISVYIEQKSYEYDLINTISTTLKAISKTTNFNQDDDALAKSLAKLYDIDRITIIRPDGKVLGDSSADYRKMENHLSRPEVANAIKTGNAYSIRHSATIGLSMLYVAVQSSSGTIIRASVEMHSINTRIFHLFPATLGTVILALLIAFILSGSFTKSFLKPIHDVMEGIANIKNGEYDIKVQNVKYEDLTPLVISVNSLAENIRSTISELRAQHDKLEFIFNSITQGIIIVENDTRVAQINNAANSFLRGNIKSAAETILDYTRNTQIIRSAEACLKSGSSSVFDIEDEKTGRILGISISPVDGEWIKKGAMILIADMTQERRSQQIRREFVANASHELKTPVTSIRGFAELISSGIVTDKAQVDDYIARIKSEAERMNVLISDILALYSLEVTNKEKQAEHVDVFNIAHEIIHNLTPQASENNVTLSLEGTGGYVYADPENIRRMLINLIENAIKYNRPDGSVTVTVETHRANCEISVKDTGIGIPPKSIPRIFERFYRADPGRSRRTGGTGLGLAIVSHIVSQLGGEISVTSTQNSGTEFIIKLPTSNP